MQQTGQTLSSLEALSSLLSPEKETNFLTTLFSQQSARVNITIELSKNLFEKLDKQEVLFRSSKELEWALEILGYGFITPFYQFIRDDQNHLENIISIYDFVISEETELRKEGEVIKVANKKVSHA